MKQKQFLIVVGILVAIGTGALFVRSSSVLPQYERELSDFIPKEEVKQTEQDWLFVEENFPSACRWEDLVKVVDGDTIVIQEEREFLPQIFGDLFTWKKEMSVRFIGIDTPETVHPNKPVEQFGPEASAKTKELLVDSERVCLLSDELSDQYDKYERRLAYVFSESGMDVNAELLKLGLARGYFSFPFSRKAEFRAYHKKAKSEKLGVWSSKKR